MTPLQVTMMLHYHAIAEPYSCRDARHAESVAVREQRARLIYDEMLETDETSRSGFRVTERGRAYVDAICRLPLPVKMWVMPDAP